MIYRTCRNLRAFWEDQMDPKSALGGPKPISRTGPPSPTRYVSKYRCEVKNNPLIITSNRLFVIHHSQFFDGLGSNNRYWMVWYFLCEILEAIVLGHEIHISILKFGHNSHFYSYMYRGGEIQTLSVTFTPRTSLKDVRGHPNRTSGDIPTGCPAMFYFCILTWYLCPLCIYMNSE